jgi:hypothetical protein
MAFIALISMNTKKKTTKMKYLKSIGINRMFLNVGTFCVTKKSISSTKKEIDFFYIFS